MAALALGGSRVKRLCALDLLALAVGLGLAGGVAEVALLGVDRYLLHRLNLRSRDVIWLAPLGRMLLLTALALPAVIVVAASGRCPKPRLAVTALAFPAALSPLLVWHPRLNIAAVLVLAVGCAVQAGRLADVHGRVRRFAVRVTPALLGALVLGAGTTTILRGLRERAVLAGLSRAPAGSPNVLLIIWDTVRASNLSLHGYDRATTPRLEALAARGSRCSAPG